MSANMNKILKEIAMIVIAIAVSFLPPPEGLAHNAMVFLGIFVWIVLNWALPVMPSYIAGLVMMLAAVLFGVVPFKTAFATFGSSTVWLIIGVLALGGAVNKTGLLSRLSFAILNVFPPSFKGQVAGLIAAGVLIGPFMPSTTAKVSIAGGFGTRIAELLGFDAHSKGMNGVFAAMYTGFSLLAATFITSSFYSYLILGMIPGEEASYFNFVSWFLAMLPWGIFTAVFSFLAISFMYKPAAEKAMTHQDIQNMAKELGPMSKDEKITLGVLVACILCWALEKFIGVPAVIPAVGGMCALFILKVLDPKEINSKVNWGIIIFCASIISLAPMVKAVGIDKWMETAIGSIMSGVGSNPYVFIVSVSILVLLSRFVLVSGTTAISLMVVILVPFCEAANMNPWIGGIIAYVVAQPFFFKYQNPNLVIGYEAAGGDEKLSFIKLIPYSFVYHVIAIAGLLLSVPYWQYLGLIH